MGGIYLDACSIVYLIEAAQPFHGKVVAALQALRQTAGPQIVTSRLSMLECRVLPIRDHDAPLLAAYDAFFSADHLILADIGARVIETATQLRATYRFRTPDAIHLATAIEEKATVFLTGDSALKQCREVNVDILI
jgi:predicted nucleic acid-binding protein